jgi:hypothetical protein
MTRIFTFLALFISTFLVAQPRERVVSGRLTDNSGQGIPGVNIIIKGTTTGVTTDINGFYSITAPIGSTLVISFIGMQTREVEVTEENLRSSQATDERLRQTFTPFLSSDSKDSGQPGVYVLSDQTPVYTSDSDFIIPQNIISVKRRRKIHAAINGSSAYRIQTNDAPVFRGFGLQLTSAFGVENVTQTPSLQNKFSQGGPVAGKAEWRGPETQELFSWGPLLRTLNFDGNNYPFDKNGMLVAAGSGNGQPAKPYNAKSFFKTGFTTEQSLLLMLPGPNQSTAMFDGTHKTRSGVIPQSKSVLTNFSFRLKNLKLAKKIVADVTATYNRADGILVNRGSNLSSIVGSVWRTPVSFDNSNDLPRKKASLSSSASRLANSDVRSHSPGFADNPYGLVHELPDKESMKRFLSTASLSYSTSAFKVTLNNTFDKQVNYINMGVAPGLAGYITGRLTNRGERLTYSNTTLTPSYEIRIENSSIDLQASYQHNFQQHDLNRNDGFGFSQETWPAINAANATIVNKRVLTRNIQELLLTMNYRYDGWLVTNLSNRNYYSTTLKRSAYTNFFPTAGVKLKLEKLLNLYSVYSLHIHGSFSRTLREAPLIYSNLAYLSTRTAADNYYKFYESQELFFNQNILPEVDTKLETGIVFSVNRLSFDAAYYHTTTTNLISPLPSGNRFYLDNVATTRNRGANASLSYDRHDYYGKINWGLSLTWNRYNAVVTDLYSNDPFVSLGGFTTTAKVLAESKSLGALYGTTYKRDNSNQILIGSDGFPLVDPSLKMIGDPIPDWTAGLNAYLTVRRFKVTCLVDFKKGGDVWNGTQAALDYYGRSSKTSGDRMIGNYVFEGIYENGLPNTTAVDFYDPAKPLQENRWVRYGFSGVGEDYVEDASWIRLQELSASYTTRVPGTRVREIKFTLISNNLFLLTPYSGVDPSATLFNYASNTGLDLFNSPATRSFTAQINVKL